MVKFIAPSVILFILASFLSETCSSQGLSSKPSIALKDCDYWPMLDQVSPYSLFKINTDGKFILYSYRIGDKATGVLQKIGSDFKQELPGLNSYEAQFTEDGLSLIGKLTGDTLFVLNLNTFQSQKIPNVYKFKLLRTTFGEMLIYQAKDFLVAKNLKTSKYATYGNVLDFLTNSIGTRLVLKDSTSVISVDLTNFKKDVVLSEAKVNAISFDHSGTEIGLVVEQKTKTSFENVLMVYNLITKRLSTVMHQSPNLIAKGLRISAAPLVFDRTGSRMFFKLEPYLHSTPEANFPSPEVYSFFDENINKSYSQSNEEVYYTAVYNRKNCKLIIIDKELNLDESSLSNATTPYIVSLNRKKRFWDDKQLSTILRISMLTGKTDTISKNEWSEAHLSPDGKMVVYFNLDNSSYYSYELNKGIRRCISKGINSDLNNIEGENYLRRRLAYGTAGWSKDFRSIFVYDLFDIWKIDLYGKNLPMNVTNGLGRKRNICFRKLPSENNDIFEGQTPFLLAAFDPDTKESGFFRQEQLGKDPVKLTLGSYVYCFPQRIAGSTVYIGGYPPIAIASGHYILSRESTTEAPNIIQTSDFKTFHAITDFKPHKRFNWNTSELIKYKMADGRHSQGILYRPEDFDPTKKYPVIFHYYELRSDELNKYHPPANSLDDINIPFFVSNGYLVFVPDMHNSLNGPGEGVMNSILPAVDYLSTLPYVNKSKLGLQGHSFAGYETLFVITHSSLFSAAVECSGIGNLTSWYGNNRQEHTERLQFNLQSTPWRKTGLYIKESPVFYIDNITTPLLIVHNKGDENVPFSQGFEMFTNMRRAGKKVWLLHYDGEGHSIIDKKQSEDYTIRMKQFFDFYLKDLPPPDWLTKSIDPKDPGFK